MAAELQHADKMRMDMIANVSHELRTPVSALQAQVENMADGVTEPTPANLESILNQTHRLSDLIAFLLDLSRMEAGAASLDIERFNFAEFLDDTIEPLEIADGGHAHIIEMNVPDDIMIEGDQDRLRQLFTNIIGNALKHSPDGTNVLVEAHEDIPHGTVVTNVVSGKLRLADLTGFTLRYLPPIRPRQNRPRHGVRRYWTRPVHRTVGRTIAWGHRSGGGRFPRCQF